MGLITTILKDELQKEVDNFCKMNDMNRGQVVRQALREFLENDIKQNTVEKIKNYKYCNCGRALVTAQEIRDGICKECI